MKKEREKREYIQKGGLLMFHSRLIKIKTTNHSINRKTNLIFKMIKNQHNHQDSQYPVNQDNPQINPSHNLK